MINQPLRLFQDSVYKLLADFRNTLLKVTRPDIQQVIQCRARDDQFHLRDAENFPGLIQCDGFALTNVSQSLGHCFYET